MHRAWRPAASPTAVVAIVHGVCEYGGRYGRVVAPALTARGFAVHAVDLRGHGASPGLRGHVDRFDEYLDDVDALVGAAGAEARTHDVSLFAFGHSMGGLILLDWLAHRPPPAPLAGAIVSAPPLVPGAAHPWFTALVRAMAPWWPRLSLPVPIDRDGLTRDPALRDAWAGDTAMHRQATLRWGAEMLAAIERVAGRAGPAIRLPVLMVHGTGDPVCHVDGTRRFFATLAATDRTLSLWEGARHEVHHDLDRAAMLAELSDWIDARRC